MFNTPLNQVDPDIQAAIEKENERQEAFQMEQTH